MSRSEPSPGLIIETRPEVSKIPKLQIAIASGRNNAVVPEGTHDGDSRVIVIEDRALRMRVVGEVVLNCGFEEPKCRTDFDGYNVRNPPLPRL